MQSLSGHRAEQPGDITPGLARKMVTSARRSGNDQAAATQPLGNRQSVYADRGGLVE